MPIRHNSGSPSEGSSSSTSHRAQKSEAHPKTAREQFSACGACRMHRVRCDLKDLPVSKACRHPSCSNCKDRDFKCVDEYDQVKSVRFLRRGRRLQQAEALYGKVKAGDDEDMLSTGLSPPPNVTPMPTPAFFESQFWRPFQLQHAHYILDQTINPLETENAQETADILDSVLDSGGLDKRNRGHYLKHLRKLCCTFAILPSSFVLGLTFDERGVEPFATGGFSDVYEATLNGRPVAIKTLKVGTAANPRKLHRLLVKEVVGWKWLQHENILPFVGVTLAPPLFSIVSERMENGNITNFIQAHPNHNRLRLLIDAATGLEYLHQHDIVHGDLKGVNVLIDSNCRARLADFGLAVVIEGSTAGSSADNRGMRGTIRWMAPELMYPEKFGFIGKYRKRLLSRSTDTYALGMTILEVVTGSRPFNDVTVDLAVMFKVLQGERPDRPPSGFSDQLWELLVATWHVDQGTRPSKRPPIFTILDRLKEDVHSWGKSIIPPTLIQPQNRAESTDTVTGRSGDDVSANTPMTAAARSVPSPFRLPQAGLMRSIQRRPSTLGVAGKFRRFLRSPRRLLGYLARPSPS